ncbi:GNAT family N-acetyltransferase [Flavobacterium sp. CYK-55]|uniref:GNAT family N-acetyltransferase n=1 Tax=Flavobacterium sp. CYK-55 TaxID=2835529 RepID=UPI001BCD619D|nr:GNAT family N-acetyltransferase [Flavobacterium sp. CYK-55]MBS7786134.1 GNAT family N-acetyltransferase [Flavobacterium sp. CYK-55]
MTSNLEWKIKRFNELSLNELYQLLQLRSEVFVVEQNCVYQDIDNKDANAIHLMGLLENEIIAYARLFQAGDYFEDASIGRVVVAQKNRTEKHGHTLMREAIDAVEVYFNTQKITISAQLYLQKFYESHGFVVVSDVYLEDDIEHIRMTRG